MRRVARLAAPPPGAASLPQGAPPPPTPRQRPPAGARAMPGRGAGAAMRCGQLPPCRPAATGAMRARAHGRLPRPLSRLQQGAPDGDADGTRTTASPNGSVTWCRLPSPRKPRRPWHFWRTATTAKRAVRGQPLKAARMAGPRWRRARGATFVCAACKDWIRAGLAPADPCCSACLQRGRLSRAACAATALGPLRREGACGGAWLQHGARRLVPPRVQGCAVCG